jgi:hypothetical protein
MEYVVGALLTLVVVSATNRLITKQLNKDRRTVVRYSQSHIYSIVAPMMFSHSGHMIKRNSQSYNYQEEAYIRVVVVDSKAYWIKENTFYTADVIEGIVDKDSTREVDTMSMSDVELKKMLVIVETLREGDGNDSGGTGKS